VLSTGNTTHTVLKVKDTILSQKLTKILAVEWANG
jgi:hypothetical protein